MFPRKFEYVAAGSVDEAVSALADAESAKVMSGGMSLIPMMKLRLLSPDLVVDIGRIPGLDRVADEGDYYAVGALVRHAQTARSDLPRALRDAASWTGDVQVRNRGTTCGAVAHADIAADQTAAVLALGATMVAQGRSGVREIPADEFFVDALTSALAPDEVLTEIRIPKRGGASAYDKLGRRGGHTDYAVAGVAVWVRKENGSVADCRIALTGVSTKPTLAEGAAAALIGTDGSSQAVAEASAKAADDITILEDLYGSEDYKAHLARVFTRRALTQALADL